MTTQHEWLEADGLGGFASGTAVGTRTRRYHALLLASQHGPAGRQVLVNGFEAFVETAAGSFAISSQHYQPGVTAPDGAEHIQSFTADPWPRWVFKLPDGTLVSQEIFVPKGLRATVLTWRLLTPKPGVVLHVRPFLSGRDYHSMHHENGAFRFDAKQCGEAVKWAPYQGVATIHAFSNARYAHKPHWSGLGHISEIADADAPHTPGGCPWQAWSLSELLRLTTVVLAEPPPVAPAPAASATRSNRRPRQLVTA